MTQFRKNPVVIDAIQFTKEDKNRAFNFITCNHYADWDSADNPTIRIETTEGEMTASLGDWIIKGVKGEFYPCKPDIFALTYEPAALSALAQEQAPMKAKRPDLQPQCGLCKGTGKTSSIGFASAGDMDAGNEPHWIEHTCRNCKGKGWVYGDPEELTAYISELEARCGAQVADLLCDSCKRPIEKVGDCWMHCERIASEAEYDAEYDHDAIPVATLPERPKA